MSRILVAAASLAAVVVVGRIAPAILISDNLDLYQGAKEECAQYAYIQAGLMVTGSAEPLFWTTLQVASVQRVALDKTYNLDDDAFRAVVKVYSYFGLPWTVIQVDCGEDGGSYRLPGGLFDLFTRLI